MFKKYKDSKKSEQDPKKSTTSLLVIPSSIATVMVHALLPAAFIVFTLFLVPQLADAPWKSEHLAKILSPFVLELSDFVQANWYLCVMLILFVLALDAAIYFFLYRFGKKMFAYVWSGLIIFAQIALVTVSIKSQSVPLLAQLTF